MNWCNTLTRSIVFHPQRRQPRRTTAVATLERPQSARERILSLRVDDSEHSELHRTAAARGITLSELLRRALVADGVALRNANA